MASSEVNGLIVKLLALAEDLGAQRKAEIVSVVGKLSLAAQRERAAAINEINRLRERAAERGGSYEPPRYNDSDAPAPRRAQAPTTRGNGRIHEVRSQPSNLDYGPDHVLRTNKQPPPPTAPRAPMDHRNPLAQPTFPAIRSATFAPPRVQAARASQSATEGPAVGFEHLNQDRFRALQAPPKANDEDEDPMSKLETLSINTQSATSANTEPVRPRVKLPGAPAVARPLNNPFNQPKYKTGQLPPPSSKKRKAAPDASEIMGATKKAKTSAVQAAPAMQKQQTSAKSQALVVAPSHVALLPQLSGGSSNEYQSSCIACPGNHGKPACVECISKKKQGCNGEAHCNHCKGKCRYILCEVFRCDDETCTLLHSCQYDIPAKGSGMMRRNVVGHTVKESALTIAERLQILRIRESVAKFVAQPNIKVEVTD